MDSQTQFPAGQTRYQSFAEFYPFYLSEHQHPVSRRLHVIGTTIGLVLLVLAIAWREPWLVLLGLVQGYAFAWVGHFFFERKRPATFRYPLYSFMGDWRMWWEVITRRRPF
jgi:hypothetical protein